MSSLIPRYAEFNATTLNTSFAALQARYEVGGNALENITSGTLTASAATIDLPFTVGAYKYLRLTTNLKSNGIDTTCLRANGDGSAAAYAYTLLEGNGASPSVFTFSNADHMFLYSDSTDPISQEMWITLTATGFNLLGSVVSHIGVNTLNVKGSGVYRGGAMTSLQLTFLILGLGGLYAATTSYSLQGLPV